MVQPKAADGSAPFVSHLLELRDRILRAVLVVLVFFLAFAPFANDLFLYLAEPLMRVLPEGNSMISTAPHGPFFVPFKFAFAVATACAMPYLLYQIWSFIAPGLYSSEKRIVVPLLLSSSALFYLGIAFAYYVVFPLVFKFFTASAPEGVAVMTDIDQYLGFTIKLFFAFGMAFEVPVATVLMIRMGVTTPEKLASKRPFIVVGAFVMGMLLTPPDIFSQTMLAVPILILFEAGLWFGRRIKRKADVDEDEDDLDEEEMERQLDEASEQTEKDD